MSYVFYTEQRIAQKQQLQQSELPKLQQHAVAEKTTLQKTLKKILNTQQLKQAQTLIKTEQKHLTQLQPEKAVLQKIIKTAQWQLEPAQNAFKKIDAKLLGNFFRDRLPDGSLGPEMVWITAGQFRSADIYGRGEDNEQSVHWMSVDIFAIRHYEVTFSLCHRYG